MSRFLSVEELAGLGLGSYHTDALIDRACALVNPEYIHLGPRVRIDAFALLIGGPAGLVCGSNVHIGAGAMLFGNSARIELEDFAGLSPRATLFTATDDFTEGHLTGPTVPVEFRRPTVGPVTLRRHALVGAGSVLLPNVEIGWGAAVGAQSLVTRSLEPLQVVLGNPARKVASRSRELIERLETAYLRQLAAGASATFGTNGTGVPNDSAV